CAHHAEAVVDFGDVDVFGFRAGHPVCRLHGAVSAGGAENVATVFADRVGGLSPAGDLDAFGFRHAQFGEALFRGEDQGGVAVGNLGTVVGLQRESFNDVPVQAVDGQGLIERDLYFVHLR